MAGRHPNRRLSNFASTDALPEKCLKMSVVPVLTRSLKLRWGRLQSIASGFAATTISSNNSSSVARWPSAWQFLLMSGLRAKWARIATGLRFIGFSPKIFVATYTISASTSGEPRQSRPMIRRASPATSRRTTSGTRSPPTSITPPGSLSISANVVTLNPKSSSIGSKRWKAGPARAF